ncbi:hypothetical protein BDZ89DRAFT_1110304 [Hymenopellis radicata]|nr:hypothetical protein BDZ89DRAFT_1110304 [Hymenopellis radicata]
MMQPSQSTRNKPSGNKKPSGRSALTATSPLSIICAPLTWFLLCYALFVLPVLLVGLFAAVVSRNPTYRLEAFDSLSAGVLAQGLTGLFFFYQNVFLLILGNVCFPTFFRLSQLVPKAPFRWHRSHVSHLRLDRFRRLVKDEAATVFIMGISASSVPLLVTPQTTGWDIMNYLQIREFLPSVLSATVWRIYVPGQQLPVSLAEMGVGPLSHLHLRFTLRGDFTDDQCALNPDGSLKEASEIEFVYDPDEPQAQAGSSKTGGTVGTRLEGCSHIPRGKNKRFVEALEQEHRNEDGQPLPAPNKRPKRSIATTRKGKERSQPGENNDDEDDEDDEDFVEVLEDEDEFNGARKFSAREDRSLNIKTDETSNSEAYRRPHQCHHHYPKKKVGRTSNSIHLFYERVSLDENGKPGQEGDMHFRCFHRRRKVFTVTQSANHHLGKLINHLKSDFPGLHCLFLVLKSRGKDMVISQEEQDFASGRIAFDTAAETQYFWNVQGAPGTLPAAFDKQKTCSVGVADSDKGYWHFFLRDRTLGITPRYDTFNISALDCSSTPGPRYYVDEGSMVCLILDSFPLRFESQPVTSTLFFKVVSSSSFIHRAMTRFRPTLADDLSWTYRVHEGPGHSSLAGHLIYV